MELLDDWKHFSDRFITPTSDIDKPIDASASQAWNELFKSNDVDIEVVC
jgi:hypothetical protein